MRKYYKIIWLLVYVDIKMKRIKCINFLVLFRYAIDVPHVPP